MKTKYAVVSWMRSETGGKMTVEKLVGSKWVGKLSELWNAHVYTLFSPREPWWRVMAWWRLGDKHTGIFYILTLQICYSSKASTKSKSFSQSTAGICGTKDLSSQQESNQLQLGLHTLTAGWLSGCGLCGWSKFLSSLTCPGSNSSNCFIRLWWKNKAY